MVTGNLLASLIEAKSLKEFKSLLRETSYGEALEKSNEDLRSIHFALENGSTESLLDLVGLSPDISKPLIKSYLMFLEVKTLKVIYRARLMKEKIDETLVYPIGNIDSTLLRHLMETETVADIKVVMDPTPYADIFNKEYASLEEFDIAIDEFSLNSLINIIKDTKMHDAEYIIDMLNKKTDILNIMALLKFRIRGVEKEKQKDLLINNKTELSLRFDELIKCETLKEFVEKFERLPYHESLQKAFEKYEKDNTFSHFEIEIYRYFKKSVINHDMGHTLGPYPLFSYLIKKEIELRNLFIISRGIEAGFSSEKIKEMVA
jgi:vacuolar-type H+-ATPase subunit C/Vma6